MIALQLAAFLYVAHTLYVVSALASARLLGARAEAASVGVGPKLFALPVGPTRIEFRPLPLVAWVVFEGMGDAEVRRGFRALHPLRRAAIVLGAWVLPALVAVALLGPARAAHHGVSLLSNVKRILMEDGAWSHLAGAFQSLPIGAALGVFLAKLTAFNVLPMPGGVSGARAFGYFVAWLAPSTDAGLAPPKWVVALGFAVVGALFLLAEPR